MPLLLVLSALTVAMSQYYAVSAQEATYVDYALLRVDICSRLRPQ